MAEENVLQLELDKLDVSALKRLATLWNINKIPKEKKGIAKKIVECMQDEFYLKGVLERLSATQVTIYTSILKSKSSILTLGEIARKIGAPPVNAEMELGVLKRYFLVYQRKNRERLTNNLDKYYFFTESGSKIRMETNEKGQKFRNSLPKIVFARPSVPKEWESVAGKKPDSAALSSSDNIRKLIDHLSDLERELLLECFQQGGILEMQRVKEIATARKGKWEDPVVHLNDLGLLLDDYYIDEKFVRLLIMPLEVFGLYSENPALPGEKKGTKKRQERRVVNDLDFVLNVKKMIVYLGRKGLNLAKSGKIKQIDLKDTENKFLRPDISLFMEKSQIYQIELLLPLMRQMDIVRVKRDDVVLRNDYDAILETDPFELEKRVMQEITMGRDRRVRYEDVFEPMYVPFYEKAVFDECVSAIQKRGKVLFFVILSSMIREKLILSKAFRIKNFQQELAELKKEISSAFFYLQLLGLISVEYPDRRIEISDLGNFLFRGKALVRDDQKGGVILNPDLSLIAIPEKLSVEGLYLLKCFLELKSFDNVFTFQLTRESFLEGLLLKKNPQELIEFLRRTCRSDLPQNLLFSIEEWSRSVPLVTITDECVLVQTQDAAHMDLLLGQISGKKFVTQKISPTSILIEQDKIPETIQISEKLNLIVRLVR
ncbi:MAG: helicase-associated domain-containing protein [Spirochaetia bacterium]|nr:helicase-associated domain-containing protein [Spirochaetia bacterium]